MLSRFNPIVRRKTISKLKVTQRRPYGAKLCEALMNSGPSNAYTKNMRFA